MTPEEIREHATSIILDGARRVEFLSVCEMLEVEDALDGLFDEEAEALCRRVHDLIRKATVTVEFPEVADA